MKSNLLAIYNSIRKLTKNNNLKQVIIIREDLKLPKGKAVAQGAHASVKATLKTPKEIVSKWDAQGMPKIVLKVSDQKQLIEYINTAKNKGLPTSIVQDAGKTVVAPGTITAGAIGPAFEKEIDDITKNLKLL